MLDGWYNAFQTNVGLRELWDIVAKDRVGFKTGKHGLNEPHEKN